MYIVVFDYYRESPGRYAIDRFPINVILDELPSTLSRRTYYGIHGVAQIDLSFEIRSDGYCAPPTSDRVNVSKGKIHQFFYVSI